MMRAAAANQGYLKTASGYPLTLEKTIAKPPENITVYGNTGGVGDRTGNLLPSMTIGKGLSPVSGKESSDTTSAVSPFIPVDFDQYSTYTFSGLVDDLYSFVAAYDSEMRFVGRTGAGGYKTRQCRANGFTGGTPASGDKIAYIRLTQYEQGSMSGKIDLIASAEIMLNTGNKAQAYEPYGFKIPILLQGRNLAYRSTMPATKNGVTFDYLSDDWYTVVGTATPDNASRAIAAILNVKPNTTYTYRIIPADGYAYPRIYIWDNNSSTSISTYSTAALGTFTTFSTVTTVAVGVGVAKNTQANLKFKVMLVEGSYTAATMPDYEPCINKTINLYSDAALGVNDSLVVSPTEQTATRGSTDVSALQDFTQNWKIPKADSLTVSAGTTVQPSSMQLAYWSKSRS